jgi:hypothetical protein
MRAPLNVDRAESAPACAPFAERELHPGRPRWLVGHVSRPPVHTGQAAPCVSRATKAVVGMGPVPISARWPGNSKKNPFPLFEIIWTILNFGNSYHSVLRSKIYEITFIGFIIFCSIQ